MTINCLDCGFMDVINRDACFVCGSRNLDKGDVAQVDTETKTQEESPPSILEKAKSFTKASVAHVVDGFNIVSDEKKQERLDICRSCEFINDINMSCKKCGCSLGIKTSWRTTSCPIGKWGPEEAKTENGIILPAYVNKPKKCKGCGKKS